MKHQREQYKDSISLKSHQRDMSEGGKYSCNICGFQTTTKNKLRTHQKAHNGIMYKCNVCDKEFTQKGHLKRHKESVHEGVKYKCNECDYQATQRGNLKTHKEAVHQAIISCHSFPYI